MCPHLIMFATLRVNIKKALIIIFMIGFSVTLCACVGTMDSAIHIKSTVVNVDGDIYHDCRFVLKNDLKGVIIFDVNADGDFRYFRMSREFSKKHSFLEVSCVGGGQTISLDLRKYQFGDAGLIDLGVNVIPEKAGTGIY